MQFFSLISKKLSSSKGRLNGYKKTFQEFHLQIPWDSFSFPRLPDPDKSFDELTAHFSAMIYLSTSLSSGAITRHWFKDRGIPHDGLV